MTTTVENVSDEIVEIYTDGACSGNPGPGGWGVLIRYKGECKELSGGEMATTNNRMELTAAIQGLMAIKRPMKIRVFTDSMYVRDGIDKWLATWKKNGWRTSQKTEVKNIDLWKLLDEQAQKYSIEWRWIKGHAGHPDNERADVLARNAIVQQIMRAEMEQAV